MAGHCRVYSTSSAAAAATASSDSFFLSGASSAFLGSRSMLSFNDVSGSKRPFYQSFEVDEFGEEDLDEYLHQPEKKRRLTVDQVRFLEKSFEEDNKLEPDRKVQLAKDLGLQPRQIAIWFQNRRARWKTKQLEKDYEVLQASYNSLAADYEKLLKEKDVLKSEVSVLSEKVLLKEKEGESSKVENNFVSEGEVSKISTKSDVLDSDSPHYYNDACLDSSYGLEPDQSDLSQDEDDSLRKGLGADTCVFPKFEDPNTNPASNSCNVGLDHAAFWSWSY